MTVCRPTFAEIDLGALRHNFHQVRRQAGGDPADHVVVEIAVGTTTITRAGLRGAVRPALRADRCRRTLRTGRRWSGGTALSRPGTPLTRGVRRRGGGVGGGAVHVSSIVTQRAPPEQGVEP